MKNPINRINELNRKIKKANWALEQCDPEVIVKTRKLTTDDMLLAGGAVLERLEATQELAKIYKSVGLKDKAKYLKDLADLDSEFISGLTRQMKVIRKTQ